MTTRAIGPRARRRLAWLAGSTAVLIVAGGAMYRFSDTEDARRSAPEPQQAVGEQSAGVAFGSAPKQVLRALGPPTRRQSGCWVYDARAHRVHGAYLGSFVDGLRYCFDSGPLGTRVVTSIDEHVVAHTLPSKKWFPGGWEPAVALEPGRA